MRLTIAVDKFRGTATAHEAAAAIAAAARGLGGETAVIAMADGGEGLLEALGGATAATTVLDAAGRPVEAAWRLDGTTAVIESARASGLLLAGGADGNDPVAATSAGTGQLIAAAIEEGATDIVVGLGGSATTDGGLGALEALAPHLATIASGAVQLTVCCDVRTRYLDAARVFGPQKGATPAQVELLGIRLERRRAELIARFGHDPQCLPGSGAAGGLGGALAVIGGTLTSGVDFVADRQDLDAAIARSDLVITGEGRLDTTSLEGKVVGGVIGRAHAAGLPVAVLVGVSDLEPSSLGSLGAGVDIVSLTERYGAERAWHDVLSCLATATAEVLSRHRPSSPGDSPPLET